MVQATKINPGTAWAGSSWTGQTEADLDVVSRENLGSFISGHTGSQVTAEWQIPRQETG